jgi:hypothetical protein
MSVSSLIASSSQRIGVPLRNTVGPVTEVELPRDRVWRMDCRTCWQVIVCRQGRIWITQDQDPQDYVLSAGEFLVVTQPGAVVVEAMQPARFQVTSSLKTAPGRQCS